MPISERKHVSEEEVPARRVEIFTDAGRRRSWSAREKAAIVATQPITSRSWQSRAKATRTTSPFQQVNSRPSEHQRTFERIVATWP